MEKIYIPSIYRFEIVKYPTLPKYRKYKYYSFKSTRHKSIYHLAEYLMVDTKTIRRWLKDSVLIVSKSKIVEGYYIYKIV